MKEGAPRPVMIGPEQRRLFAVLHAPPRIPKAGVLVCAPFFHEYILSYRLFALLGGALAELGTTVLRFDYFATGDSAGVDTDFSLAGACEDTERALAFLRRCTGDVPLAILGVRAGAMPAVRVATGSDLGALWLWQPILDGARYVDELQQRNNAGEPQGDGPVGTAHVLDGFPCNAELERELRREELSSRMTRLRTPVTMLDDGSGTSDFAWARRIILAPSLHNWVGQVDLRRFPSAPVHELARNLAVLPELQ